ncbi:MAG: DUF4397 domain-containing protein [Haloarculaceae archaeon]
MVDQHRETSESASSNTDRVLERRRFLAAAGAVGSVVALAGCGGGGGNGTNGTTDGTTDGTTMGTTDGGTTDGGTTTETTTETETTTQGTAMARVGHLSPNAPNVDVYVDGDVVLSDVPFGTISDYLELPAGAHTIRITPAGDSETTVFEGDVTVEADQVYTALAIGEVGENVDQPFQPLVLTDNNTPPDSGTARLRVVHASPDAPAVDVTAGDTVLFDGLAFGDSGYTEVPAGDYTVQIRPDTESNDGDVVAEFDVTLEGQQVYSAFAAGYLSPEEAPADVPFDLIVTQDTQSMSGGMTTTSSTTTTSS